MMEEPVVKKVKIVENPVEVIDIPIAEGIKEAPVISLKVPDLAKLKLDSMFNRNSKKKYVRPVTTTFDNYNDIDKLMNQYAGNKEVLG